MVRDIQQVVADINGLTPADPDDLDLDRLHALAAEYFSSRGAAEHLAAWFRLYERFPEFDGYGVFWTILHGIEAQPGSDQFVVQSVRRRPSRFPVSMVNRLLNAGVARVDGTDLLGLLGEVAASSGCPTSVCEDAARFLAYQSQRADGPTEEKQDTAEPTLIPGPRRRKASGGR